MQTLQTLIKLQKAYVDEQRQQLAKLQDLLDAIVRRIAELEIQKVREQLAAENHPDARATYGAFLKAINDKARELEKERKTMEQIVEQARTKLSMLFEEQKRYEIAEEARVAAEQKEERRRESIAFDEIGGTAHERRRNTKDET